MSKARNLKSLHELASSMSERVRQQRADIEARRVQRGNQPRGDKPSIEAPPSEQLRAGIFEIGDTLKAKGGSEIRIGKAYRRKPMIDTLLLQKVITVEQHKALRHYRHHADMADRSPLKDSLNRTRGGTGTASVTLLNAARVVRDCEAAAGSLRDILRAVVVDDLSLSQWAIQRSGAIDDCEVVKGRVVCRVKPRQKALALAKLEFVVAAERVEAELAA